jgi:pimeloyl-ACP methyl ester carboxylesterase
MRALKIFAAIAALSIAITTVFVLIALRDSPGREASGTLKRVQSGDAEIAYYDAGESEDPLVVLLPSYGRSVSDFNELRTALHRAGFRTLAVQPRGVGSSTLPSFDISLHTLADDVIAVLDAEGKSDPINFLGHAFGNRIVRTIAEDHPERVAGLILLAAGGARPTPPETAKAIFTALLGLGSDSKREESVHFAFFSESNRVPEYWLRGWYPRAGLAQARAMSNTPLHEWVDGGAARILVLEPAEDAVAAGAGAMLREKHADRVRVIMIEGAGHALLPERPKVVAREVIAYLGGSR